MRKIAMRWWIALAVFVIPWAFWLTAISSASNGHFLENQFAVQTMVVGGAISMVAGSIAIFWGD